MKSRDYLMKIDIISLFPNMFKGFLEESIIKRAIEKGVVEINVINPRPFANNKHHHVDDTPYGGGAGMVLQCEPLFKCFASIEKPCHTLIMTPQGTPYKQEIAKRLAKEEHLVIICGHYEGFDERIRTLADEQISIGDYVLTGGEIPSMAIADSIVRLLDGAITNESLGDSFYDGLLEYPQYTKPQEFEGMKVPDVLLSGNHEEIRKWRLKESLRNTYLNRPDLLENRDFTKEELKFLEEIKVEIEK